MTSASAARSWAPILTQLENPRYREHVRIWKEAVALVEEQATFDK